MTTELKTQLIEKVAKIIGGDDSAFIESVAEALHASSLLDAVETLERIKTEGTTRESTRIGDAYREDGWSDYEVVYPLAEIATAVLAKLGG